MGLSGSLAGKLHLGAIVVEYLPTPRELHCSRNANPWFEPAFAGLSVMFYF